MMRVLKPNGFLFLIVPSAGPIHRYPVDCYRFYPDSFRALAKYGECHLVDMWHDNRGPWNDLVGVFSKTEIPQRPRKSYNAAEVARSCLLKAPPWPPKEHEVVSGKVHYLETLKFFHESLMPKNYLEIGIRKGESLALSQCPSVGVDPLPDIDVDLPPGTIIHDQASDEFFAQAKDPILEKGVDFAFIDGMHWFEFALRDFMHVEKYATPTSVVVIDDIFPNHPKQAQRRRETVHWAGDVWKLYEVLKKYRSDLTLIPLDTKPTGLLVITGLDPTNKVLWEQYNKDRHPPPAHILNRKDIVSPEDPKFKHVAMILKVARTNNIALSTKTTQISNTLSNKQDQSNTE